MTEREWLASNHPETMLAFVRRQKGNRRKRRLFACACVRRVLPVSEDDLAVYAIEVAELFADAKASLADLVDAADDVDLLVETEDASTTPDLARWYARAGAAGVAMPPSEWKRWSKEWAVIVSATESAAHGPVWASASFDQRAQVCGDLRWAESNHQADLLRCIFGNPFRRFEVDFAWLTEDVRALAVAAYEERDLPGGELEPARLWVLADALEEAGAAGELLEHLRRPGPHVRGCHVVDALTGRS